MKSPEDLLGNQSLPWEVAPDWEKVVCQAIINYPLAPRHAKIILDITGKLVAEGLGVEMIIERLRG